MRDRTIQVHARLALPLLGALALAACGGDGGEEERMTYEADVTDESGGAFVVTDPEDPRVEDLDLPETPMTPVPPGETPSPAETPEPSPTPAPTQE